MKTKLTLLTLLSAFCLQPLACLQAGTTIDPFNKYAWGANFGWLDWSGGSGQTATGAVIGEYVCSGYIYSANVGWINLGSGTPADQIQYQNNSATDFGVNLDAFGNLTGYAYGANVGWITFEQTYGQPKVNLFNGHLSGSVWSANCGWISLSNAVAYVQTDSIQPGALAPDGLPIAWLLQNFGTTNVDANADPDGDGMSNMQEYLAGTDPNNAASVLRITSFQRDVLAPSYNQFAWDSVPTRFYAVQANNNLPNSAGWTDVATFNFAGVSAASFFDYTGTNNFYRIRAYRPLTP